MLVVPGYRRGGQQACRAVASVRLADREESLLGAVHEVVSVAAVNVHIHEARRQVAAGQVDCLVRRWRRAGRP